MIYIYNKESQSNIYGPMSDIKYVLEYYCSSIVHGRLLVNLPCDQYIYIAGCTQEYIENWIKRNEYHERVFIDKFMPSAPVAVIEHHGKIFHYWYRELVEIDWSKDYHFFYNKYQKDKKSLAKYNK